MAKVRSSGMTNGVSQRGGLMRPQDAKDVGELNSYLQSRGYRFQVDPKFDQSIPFEAVANGVDVVERVYSELGLAPNELLVYTINSNEHRDNAIMSASFYGDVQYNAKFFGGVDKLAQLNAEDTKGYHPPMQDYTGYMAHELGHSIEAYLLAKRFTNNATGQARYDRQAVLAWIKHKLASEIIHEAAMNLKKRGETVSSLAWSYANGKIGFDNKRLSAKGNAVEDFVGNVSGYARSNRSEALAECVGDYLCNGSKASPLAREVWNIIKREIK